ncbi:MAG: hypothetical protein NC548_18185 [Lachnospiraceae bacterium]|nr:hypothetical protein [Lachnospiraceae bacterium]
MICIVAIVALPLGLLEYFFTKERITEAENEENTKISVNPLHEADESLLYYRNRNSKSGPYSLSEAV